MWQVITLVMAFLWTTAVQAATLAPAIVDLEGVRGERVTAELTLINTSSFQKTYFLGSQPFQGRDDSGVPEFIPLELAQEGLSQWITFPSKQVLVEPNAFAKLPIEIIIPSDVPSGDYYAAITVADRPHEVVATNGATIEAKTASLLFLTVKGETREQAQVLDFAITHRNALDRRFTISYRLQNQGNIRITPNAYVVFQDVFGRERGRVEVNPDKLRILPATTRTIEVETQPLSGIGFGLMQASLVIESGFGTPACCKQSLWVISWTWVLGGGLVLLASFVLIKRFKQS